MEYKERSNHLMCIMPISNHSLTGSAEKFVSKILGFEKLCNLESSAQANFQCSIEPPQIFKDQNSVLLSK